MITKTRVYLSPEAATLQEHTLWISHIQKKKYRKASVYLYCGIKFERIS